MCAEGLIAACQFVFNYVIKLGTMFVIWNIPPATRSNAKQNIQFQNKLMGNNAEATRVTAIPRDVSLVHLLSSCFLLTNYCSPILDKGIDPTSYAHNSLTYNISVSLHV